MPSFSSHCRRWMLEIEAITQSSKKCIWKALIFCISPCPRDSRRGKANPEDVFAAITLPASYSISPDTNISLWDGHPGQGRWDSLAEDGRIDSMWGPSAASALPWNLLDMQNFRLHQKQKLRAMFSKLCYNKPSRRFFCTLKFEMHWEDHDQVGFRVQEIKRLAGTKLIKKNQVTSSKLLKLIYMTTNTHTHIVAYSYRLKMNETALSYLPLLFYHLLISFYLQDILFC